MRTLIWGCRGSLAAPGPDTVRYGGNTACVEVRLDDGAVVILDAGTGMRPLGAALDHDTGPIHILLSHLHLDHVQGLGFFLPLWNAGAELHIWGPRSAITSLEERMARYLSPPLFPVHLRDIPSHLTFHDAPEEEWSLGAARLLSEPVLHQGPTLGYRIESGGWSLAYLPDHEPALGGDLELLQPTWISGYRVAQGADVLLHDAQYTEDEYARRVGWGHSSIEQTVLFAQRAGVGQLVLFHHDPNHSDEDLESLLDRARSLWDANDSAPRLAAEGMEIAPGQNDFPALSGRASSVGD